LDLATENSKQSANFLFGPLLICQKKKGRLVTVYVQSLSSVVPTGGSVECQQDCQLVLNLLLTFREGLWIFGFNSQFKRLVAAMLLAGYLADLYLGDLLSSPGPLISLSLEKPPRQE